MSDPRHPTASENLDAIIADTTRMLADHEPHTVWTELHGRLTTALSVRDGATRIGAPLLATAVMRLALDTPQVAYPNWSAESGDDVAGLGQRD